MNSSEHHKYLLTIVLMVWAGLLHLEAQPGFVTLVGCPKYSTESGERGMLELTFLIKDGFHIQSAIVDNDNFIPTLLTAEQPDGISFGTPVFPLRDTIQGGEAALFYGYQETIEVSVPLEIKRGTAAGCYDVSFTLSYQACKDASCFFSRKLNFNVRLRIEKNRLTLHVDDGQTTKKQTKG